MKLFAPDFALTPGRMTRQRFLPIFSILVFTSAATAASIHFTATDINPGNHRTEGWAMNSSGAITGSWSPTGGSSRAFIYHDGQMHDVPVPQGYYGMTGQSINDANQIGGSMSQGGAG